MAYEAKTQDNLAKWWFIGTGTTRNRLHDLIIHDCPLGPAIYYTTGWTAGTVGIVLTVSINAAGSGYTALDVLTLTGGGNDCTVRVDTVDGGGGVTGITLLTGGTGYAVNNYAVTGGTGANDARINVLTKTVEYYRTSAQSTANDSTQEKIGAGAWAALAAGTGIGALAAGQWIYASGNLYVRLTGDVTPNATNQVRAHYLWDGSGAGPVMMTEVVEDAIYTVTTTMELGDNSTTTALLSTNEHVYFIGAFQLRANATLTLGVLNNSVGTAGAFWSLPGSINYFADTFGTLNMYGSMITYRSTMTNTPKMYFKTTGNSLFVDSIIYAATTGTNYAIAMASVTMTRGVLCNDSPSGYINISGGCLVTDTVSNADLLGTYSGTNITYTGLTLTYPTVEVYVNNAITLTLINIAEPTTIQINNASGIVLLRYSCSIHVADKDGANLSGVTVLCEDQFGTTVFSDTTDANGNLTTTPQTITYKQWAGTLETLTTYSPHKFTLSKPGYRTLVLDAITVDDTIDWHLELQDAKVLDDRGKLYYLTREDYRLRAI